MHVTKYFFILPLMLVSQNSFAMGASNEDNNDLQQPAAVAACCEEKTKEDIRKRDIHFKTTAIIKLGLSNKKAPSLLDAIKDPENRCNWWQHPLLEHSMGQIPYTQGNGGLLNPILRNWEQVKENIKGEGYTGLRIAINGCVSADGIDAYKFDNTHIGKHFDKYVMYKGERCKKGHYQMSELEEAILGFLQERVIDRQKSDLCKGPFCSMEKLNYADRFAQCIKHEWTSVQNAQDTGIRTEMEKELIERYMARNVYWPSQWQKVLNMRTGERIRQERLDPAGNDPHASVELSEFEVTVKIPGASDDCTVM